MFWLLASASAWAQTTPAAAAVATGEQPSLLMSLVPFIFIFAIMYFLVIRPQGRKQKDHQKFLLELKRGDDVVTASGILGRIEGITDQFVTLEIADGVRVKMVRTQVAASTRSTIEQKKDKQ